MRKQDELSVCALASVAFGDSGGSTGAVNLL